MERLPEEILSYIFQHLSVSDRKEAALVCKFWYNASLHPRLLRDTVVTFHAPSSSPRNFDKLGHRKTPHLILDQIDGSFTSKQFLLQQCSHLTSNLQSLSLKGSNITENLCTELLSQCINLESLDLSCCNSLFMSGLILSKTSDVEKLSNSLAKIKALNLSNIRYLSDTTFNRIISVCPQLQKLQLSACQIIFHSEKYFSKSSDSVFTFNNILLFLGNNAEKIKSLDFSRTAITDEALKLLAIVKGLSLDELVLIGCRDVHSDGICCLSKKQTKLNSLILSQCFDLCDRSLLSISENLQDIKILGLSKCRQLTDASISKLRNLIHLIELDLSSNYTITSKGLCNGLCKGNLQEMKNLNLNCCSLVKDSLIIQLSKVFSNLIHLDIGSTAITDIGLQFICTYMFRMKSLNLSWCREISDKGLMGTVLELECNVCLEKNENEVCRCTKNKMGENILNLPKIEDKKKKSAKNALLQEPASINNLTCLTTLDLTSCPKISDDCIAILKLPQLRNLFIGTNKNITDTSLKAISSNLKCLEKLSVSQCNEITDDGIVPVVRSLRRLISLHFSNCDKVTIKSLQAIQSYSQALKDLDVSMCGKIPAKEMEKLEYNMRQLHTVHKRLIGDML